MTETGVRPKREVVQDRVDPDTDRVVALPNAAPPRRRRRYGGALFGATALLLLLGSLGIGGWRHYQAELAVAATMQRSRTAVPEVRLAAVRASDSKITVSLPATTTAFEAANIFARTSGYVDADDSGPLAPEHRDRRRADPAAGAGHDADLVLEPHALIPSRSRSSLAPCRRRARVDPARDRSRTA